MSDQIAYHTLAAERIADELGVVIQHGLETDDIRQRQESYGPNEIEGKKPTGFIDKFLHQFADFMIIVLLVAAAVAIAMGEIQDSIVILIIVILNALIGAIQEYRAERALEALRKITAPEARVRRAGHIHSILSSELVPGDIVLLEAGNIVPADLRLVQTVDLEVDESALTGESLAVAKQPEELKQPDLPLGDRRNMLYKGTHITRGHATCITVATAAQTELGHIATLLRESKSVMTPLQNRLARFGKRLALAILGIALIVFIVGLLRGEEILLMLLTAVSLAVAAIPEALPAVVTISLALGANKLGRRHALMRRLSAVETLGSITYICSDKTGTLTQNKMQVAAIYADAHRIDDLSAAATRSDLLRWLGQAMALCNNVTLDKGDKLNGDPTEVALYLGARDGGFHKQELEQQYPRTAELPFHAERRIMTTLHRCDKETVAFAKGAPEAILPLCRHQLTEEGETDIDQQTQLAQANELAAQGYRVLAVAMRRFAHMPANIIPAEIESDLTLLGLVGLIDPPRPEVLQAIDDCRTAGIVPVMITGDHPGTAQAIAHELGIGNHHGVLTGAELDQLSDEAFEQKVVDITVYARANPEQKIRIVTALQQHGEYVAMTGDGVNDAPALKRANIGVAMGCKGTDVAREASDMVLTDDNFATIVTAVREGRRIFDNIRKFIKYTMTSNSGEIWTIFLAPFLGLPLPLLPIQILWINLVTDGLPGLALSVEPQERHIMQRPPRPPGESIFSHGMWQHMLWVGLLIGGLSLGAQAWAYHAGSDNWQTVVFTVLTFSQLVHALVIRSERESLFTIGLFSNLALLGTVILTIGLQLMVIYLPFLNHIFHTTPLNQTELLVCFILPLFVFVAVEMEKWLVRRGWLYQTVLTGGHFYK